jgi:hypothetical protein
MRIGAACVDDGVLIMDVDADGTLEHFDATALQESGEAPAELAYRDDLENSCGAAAFSFSLAEDRRVVGVVDLDDDGRDELVVKVGTSDFWLYGAPNSPARLELIARTSSDSGG